MNKIFSILVSLLLGTSLMASASTVATSKVKKNVTDSLKMVTEKAEQGDAVAQNTLGLWYYTGKHVKRDYRVALTWWSKSAQQDNADAIGNMAICFQLGNGTKKDSLMAMNLYKTAIQKGNKNIIPQHEAIVKNTNSAFSCRLLYDCYTGGIGVKRDMCKAEEYMKRLAEYGDTDMAYTLALACLNSKRSQEAASLFKAAAEKGHVGALYYYGYMTQKGMGVKQDKAGGMKLLQAAADKGFRAAYYQLGRIYYEGDGVDKDLDKASDCLLKVAAANKNAAWLLALCYLEKTPQELFFAMQWMSEAARSHEKEFNELMETHQDDALNDYVLGLRAYYIKKDYAAAMKLFKSVDKKGSAEGLTMQAMCLANQKYEKNNPKKAAKTLEKAVKAGSVMALYCLSSLYENGKGVEKDDARALELLSKAADGGIGYAQCKLGDMYFRGKGVAQDYVQAAKYYLAAEGQCQLTPASAKNLVTCYERGISSIPDLKDAKQRIEKLKTTKENNHLVELLRDITE